MRILLISTYLDFPVGLRYIAAFLEKYGHEVFLRRLNPANQKRFIQTIAEIKPKVVGFTCYTQKVLEVLVAAQLVKQFFPQTMIVLGNIHATVFYKKILEGFPFVDYVVLGEGEVAMKELMEHITGIRSIDEVHNIAYRNKDGNVIKTREQQTFPDLDDLSDFPQCPMPKELFTLAYHRFSYAFKRRPFILQAAPFFTSRGCPYDCDYCAESSMSHRRWRAKSPEKVVRDIKKIYKKYNISHFSFQDPFFTFDRERVKRICAELERHRLKITWAFQTHPNHIDEGLVYALSRAGCIALTMGIDCFTNTAMNKHRKTTLDYNHLAKVIRLIRELKMIVKLNIIVGWPEGKLKDLVEAARHIIKLHPTHLAIHTLQIIPGSQLYNQAAREGVIDENRWLNRKNNSLDLAIYDQGKIDIKGYLKLRVQQIVINAAHLIHCRNIYGVLFMITYTIGCWLNIWIEYIREHSPHRYFCRQQIP